MTAPSSHGRARPGLAAHTPSHRQVMTVPEKAQVHDQQEPGPLPMALLAIAEHEERLAQLRGTIDDLGARLQAVEGRRSESTTVARRWACSQDGPSEPMRGTGSAGAGVRATGGDGPDVLDVDVAHGKVGYQSLHAATRARRIGTRCRWHYAQARS